MLSRRKYKSTWRATDGFLEDVTLMTQRMNNSLDHRRSPSWNFHEFLGGWPGKYLTVRVTEEVKGLPAQDHTAKKQGASTGGSTAGLGFPSGHPSLPQATAVGPGYSLLLGLANHLILRGFSAADWLFPQLTYS